MINKQVLIFMLLISIIITSCEKETIDYPISFESNSVTKIGIGVYTKGGKLTNQVLIDNIINRYENHFTELADVDVKGVISITYKSPNEVEVIEKPSVDVDYRDEYNISGITYWEKRDTTRIMSSEFGYFLKNHLKYHPIYQQEFDVPHTSDIREITEFKHCYYMKKENGKIIRPMLDFFKFNGVFLNSSSIGATKINNEFDKNSIEDLSVNDTLIIQEYYIEIKKM